MLAGRAIRWIGERDLRLWRTIVIIVAVAWSSVIFDLASPVLIDPTSKLDPLLYAIVGGIPVIASTILSVLVLRRRYSGFFEETEKAMEEHEES